MRRFCRLTSEQRQRLKQLTAGGIRISAVISLFAAIALAATARAQVGQQPSTSPQQAAQAQLAAADDAGQVELSAGRSILLRVPFRASRVAVAEPRIADVQAITPDQVLVIGKAPGWTDLIIWGEDERAQHRRVHVGVDVDRLNRQIQQMFPGQQVEATEADDVLTVRGTLPRVEDIQALRDFLTATELRYVDLTSVAGVQQVLLKVRVAEASRQALRSLGINAVHAGNDFFGGSTIGGNPNNIDVGVADGTPATSNIPFTFNSDTAISSAVTLFAGIPDADLQIFLQALEQNQYLRTLAEPTLVALSGEEASFLAGGEFPIPVVQGTGAGGGTSISIEFKEFGVRLRFRPIVLGDGTIRLYVAPEVSDLTDVGSVEIEGFQIPSLLTRRAQTTLEMKSGQSFAMAGLIDRSITARAGKVPGFGSIPILGSLFRSVRYEAGETELVVMVTVSLVEPLNTVGLRPLPGDLHRRPTDWELYLNGEIEGEAPPNSAPVLKGAGLDRLHGPGAWSSYDQPRLRTLTTAPEIATAQADVEPVGEAGVAVETAPADQAPQVISTEFEVKPQD